MCYVFSRVTTSPNLTQTHILLSCLIQSYPVICLVLSCIPLVLSGYCSFCWSFVRDCTFCTRYHSSTRNKCPSAARRNSKIHSGLGQSTKKRGIILVLFQPETSGSNNYGRYLPPSHPRLMLMETQREVYQYKHKGAARSTNTRAQTLPGWRSFLRIPQHVCARAWCLIMLMFSRSA